MTSDAALADKYAPLFLGVAEQFALLAASAEEDWDAAAKRRVDFPRLTAVRKCEDEALKAKMQGVWNGCKKTAKGFDEVFSVTSAEAMEDLRAMAPAMLALLKLTADFSCAYQEKRRRNAADFSDQEHEAIDLLLGADGQPTDLARTVSQHREIMVDEYQDTNEVQNCIFSAISREGKKPFSPSATSSRASTASASPTRVFSSTTICATRTPTRRRARARSSFLRKTSARAIRCWTRRIFVFRNVLSREMGELDYGEDESLHVGGELSPRTRLLHGVPFCGDVRAGERHGKSRAAEPRRASPRTTYKGSSPTASRCRTIKRTSRAVREEDIVILMRSPTRLADYCPRVEDRGVRCEAATAAFYETMEVAVTLRAARNIGQPAAGRAAHLCAALAAFRLHAEPSRRAARENAGRRFLRCTRRGRGEDSVRFLALLRELRESAQTLTLTELVAALYERCHIPAVFGAMRGERHAGKIFVRSSRWRRNLSAAAGGGLFAFVRHLREQLESGEPPVPQTTHAAQGVRIMSIHKSRDWNFRS